MSFEGKNVAELRKSFRDVFDAYLANCKRACRLPEKPYNGTIILRAPSCAQAAGAFGRLIE
jgi:predicted HicB family RNase H-like nuclease